MFGTIKLKCFILRKNDVKEMTRLLIVYLSLLFKNNLWNEKPVIRLRTGKMKNYSDCVSSIFFKSIFFKSIAK